MRQFNTHQKEIEIDQSELQEDNETAAFLLTKGYKVEQRIGNGTFGKVYLVYSFKYKTHFVIKKITSSASHKNDINEEIFNERYDYKEVKNLTLNSEIQSLILLDHPGIIKLYEYFSQPIIKGENEGESSNYGMDGKKEEENVFLVLEYCQNGSLNNFIRKGPIKPPKLYSFCKQIASALLYCHTNGIAHRDIKPANILVGVNDRMKLGDFGLSTIIKEGQKCNKYAGSYLFMAPEVLDMKDFDPYEADVWALGITFYMMATGVPPWYSSSREVLRKMAKTADLRFPSYIDRNFANLIRSMLTHDPIHRATMKNVASHPILQQIVSHSSLYEIKFNTKVSFNHATMNGIELNQIIPNYNNTSILTNPNNIQDLNGSSKNELHTASKKTNQPVINAQNNFNDNQNELIRRKRSSSFCPPFPSSMPPHSLLPQNTNSISHQNTRSISHQNSAINHFPRKDSISTSSSLTKILQDTSALRKNFPPIPSTSNRPKIQMFSSTPLLKPDQSINSPTQITAQNSTNESIYIENDNDEINIEQDANNWNEMRNTDNQNDQHKKTTLDSVKTFKISSLDARRRTLMTPRKKFRSQAIPNNNVDAC